MAEKKGKIPLTGNIKVPENVDREIDMEASRLGLFKYEVLIEAWKAYKSASQESTAAKGSDSPNRQGDRSSYDVIELTEDQQDLLDMLAGDPDEFLFGTLQTAVQSALKEYRKKWKPQEPSKKKAARKSAVHPRRTTGT